MTAEETAAEETAAEKTTPEKTAPENSSEFIAEDSSRFHLPELKVAYWLGTFLSVGFPFRVCVHKVQDKACSANLNKKRQRTHTRNTMEPTLSLGCISRRTPPSHSLSPACMTNVQGRNV